MNRRSRGAEREVRTIKRLSLAVLILASQLASADTVDTLIGTWESPDGNARQQFVREFDGSWVTTRMWFRSGDDWKLVATGSMFQRPGDDRWFLASRTTDMDGILLFESVLSEANDGVIAVTNKSYLADGSVILTEEEWRFDGGDHYEYVVFRLEDDARTEWFRGSWNRE